MNPGSDFDVIIIGGGPAGSTAASVLAQKGRRVVVLEKEKFPRYHIGESLIPYTYFPLERIGMIEQMKASHFTVKLSVQFVGQRGRASQPFYFFNQLKHEAASTWQVRRSEFDQMLLDNARKKGAQQWRGDRNRGSGQNRLYARISRPDDDRRHRPRCAVRLTRGLEAP